MSEAKKTLNFPYAGFWKRFAAALIDLLLVIIVVYGILFLLEISGLMNLEVVQIPFVLFAMGFPWMYFAKMESSDKQATLGKLALKIKVAGLDGGRINFAKASGRYWAKFIPLGLVYITNPVPNDVIGAIALSIATTLRHPFSSFEYAPFITILSLAPFIWFGSIAFTAKKQAPHDMVTKCLVLKK